MIRHIVIQEKNMRVDNYKKTVFKDTTQLYM